MAMDSSEASGSPAAVPEQVTWSDIAPWLRGRRTDPEFFWIDEAPSASDPQVRQANCDLIAVLIAETGSPAPLGELLPLLPPGIDLIPDDDLPTRTANWLLQSSNFTTDRIRKVTAADILASHGMGMGSVLPLLSRLVALSTEASAHGHDGPDDREHAVARLLHDFETIARWYRLTGAETMPLLAEPPEYAPADVREARARLARLTAQAPAVAAPSTIGVAEQLSAQLDELGDRDLEVFIERRLGTDRTRLEALGERFGVSRERVRQYEARALDSLFGWLETSAEAQFVIASAIRVIDTVRPLDDLVSAVPALGEEVDATGHPLWRVVVGIGAGFDVVDGWAVAESIDAARAATETLLTERADEHGVLPAAVLADLNTVSLRAETTGWPAEWAAWLGHTVYDGHVLLRTGTVEDYAAAILSIEGRPLTAEELVERFHVERSARSVVNQMINDDRFQRVSRTHWGLRAWGGPVYESIRTAITGFLDEHGGSAPLDDLIDALTSSFDVKAGSVVSYAATAPFQTRDGVVTRAENSPAPRKSPAQTRHLYRVGDAWKLRFTVSREHLRGSGSPLPVALATALNLEHGETRHLESPDGTQLLSWTALQPTLGSTRRLLADRPLHDGDEAFFVFTGNRFDIEELATDGDDPLRRVLARIGAPMVDDPASATVVLATAVGLPADTALADVAAAFAARGEEEIAELISA